MASLLDVEKVRSQLTSDIFELDPVIQKWGGLSRHSYVGIAATTATQTLTASCLEPCVPTISHANNEQRTTHTAFVLVSSTVSCSLLHPIVLPDTLKFIAFKLQHRLELIAAEVARTFIDFLQPSKVTALPGKVLQSTGLQKPSFNTSSPAFAQQQPGNYLTAQSCVHA